jgi:hypothetical protein
MDIEIPGMQQQIDRAMGEGMRLKGPRVKRAIDDEDDYADQDAGQNFYVMAKNMARTLAVRA